MGPGMPGFGIASLFYVAAALLAPFNELIHLRRGTSTPERRRVVVAQFLVAIAIVVALVLFYLGLGQLVSRGWIEVNGRGSIAGVPNWVFAVLTLLVVLLIGTIAGGLASLRAADDPPDQVAAAHRAGVAQIVLDLRISEKEGETDLVVNGASVIDLDAPSADELVLVAAPAGADTAMEAAVWERPSVPATPLGDVEPVPESARPEPPTTARVLVLTTGRLRTVWLVDEESPLRS